MLMDFVCHFLSLLEIVMAKGTVLDFKIGVDFDESDWNVIAAKRESVLEEVVEPSKHQLAFHKEKRRGKVVTLVGPFSMEKDTLKSIFKVLKKKLGCGGTINEDFLEFQGDIQGKLRSMLEERAFRFKKR